MNFKSLVAAAAIATASATSFAAVGNLGSLPPSASFSNNVTGAFSDSWTFNLGLPSVVAASLTNVEVTFGSGFGGITGFAATLNGVALSLSTSTVTPTPGTFSVTTQVLAGGTLLPAGVYNLVVSGTGITGASASYGGSIVAAPVPEPESYAMLLAGLGVMGAIAVRRKKSKQD